MREPELQRLDRLVGTWTTEATHPAMPGVVVHGTVVIEWLEGERFLIHRARTDHPDFPDSISIVGFAGRERAGVQLAGAPRMTMHYFDSRGVSRVYDVEIDDASWRFALDTPGMAQRFTGTFADRGDTIVGHTQMREDDQGWAEDLRITYRRQASR